MHHSFIMQKVCRLCGESSREAMYNIFNKNDSGQQIIKLIKQCLPILVYRADPLPKEICERCYSKLNDFSTFQKSTIDVHDKFKENLSVRIDESPVKLYIDALEDEYQPEEIQFIKYHNPGPPRYISRQSSPEPKNNSTNTFQPKISAPVSLKILTPNLINENMFVSLQSEDGTIQKKRRLAGPKSKTRIQHFFPQTLLQLSLNQINKDMNLTEDFQQSASDNTSEFAMETETSDYTMSRSSQERDYSPDLSAQISLPELDFNFVNPINIHAPATCNYCEKTFDDMLNLAYHEIKHIKVDIGPRVDSKDYGKKCRKYVGYYHNFLARQSDVYVPQLYSQKVLRPKEIKEVKPDPRPIRVKVPTEKSSPKVNSKPINPKLIQEQITPKVQHTIEEDNNSLLVPQQPQNYVFKLENYEVFVNGVPLKSMTKEERRASFKDMLINEQKRKYCPICRHTFKDNWAIETHYLTDVCQYTCKYCGRKYKYQKHHFESHLELHKDEPINKIFGPAERRYRFKKKVRRNNNRTVLVGQMLNVPPKVKPIKMKQLMQKKNPAVVNISQAAVKIKSEPGLNDVPIKPSSSGRGRTEPYQAYFCRKCFKVFFNVNEYNKHIRICTGAARKTNKNSDAKSASSESSSVAENSRESRRPQRSCVKEITVNNDSDVDSDEVVPKKSIKKVHESPETGYECTICCSAFPSFQSRNSHMRIHKGHPQLQQKTVLNKVAPNSHTITKVEPVQITKTVASNATSDIRLSNLNPAVARLVQNNPHLTIRSYSKAQVEKHNQEKNKMVRIDPPHMSQTPPPNFNDNPEHNIKRVYKCADCEEKFENKSVLYYHKMNSCIVKRHYECAFCRKKFGTYDQYNTHMFYVHPE